MKEKTFNCKTKLLFATIKDRFLLILHSYNNISLCLAFLNKCIFSVCKIRKITVNLNFSSNQFIDGGIYTGIFAFVFTTVTKYHNIDSIFYENLVSGLYCVFVFLETVSGPFDCSEGKYYCKLADPGCKRIYFYPHHTKIICLTLI